MVYYSLWLPGSHCFGHPYCESQPSHHHVTIALSAFFTKTDEGIEKGLMSTNFKSSGETDAV
jgi:hypothetical protein